MLGDKNRKWRRRLRRIRGTKTEAKTHHSMGCTYPLSG